MSDPAARDQEQFTKLVVAHQRRLYGFIYTLVNHHPSTEDLLQEVTSLLWTKFDSFELGTDFGAWAMKVARFKVLEWRRAQSKAALPIGDELLLELAQKAEQAQQDAGLGRLEALEGCVASLPEKDQHLIQQRYTEHIAVSRIADQMGKKRDTIYKALAKIHGTLQRCVESKLREQYSDL